MENPWRQSQTQWEDFLRNHEQFFRDIAHALVNRQCVAYIGAGVSKPSGFPLWKELLTDLTNEYRFLFKSEDDFSQLLARSESDPTLVAEVLANIAEPVRLRSSIRKRFLCGASETEFKKPCRIHHELTRLGFRFLLTTNYDNLLEAAFREPQPVYTWRQIEDIQGALQSGLRAIIKIHGDVQDGESIVLTASQYRELQFSALAFQNLLETIFLTNTIFFVGTSLTDNDLLHLLNRMIAKHGDSFGPHYALVSGAALLPHADSFYLKQYRIHLFRYNANEAPFSLDAWTDDPQAQIPGPYHEAWTSTILQEIGGRVASQRAKDELDILLDQPEFSGKAALQQLLNSALPVTGSFRGDICTLAGIDRGELQFFVQAGGDALLAPEGHPVPPISVIGTAFTTHALDGYLYARNVARTYEPPYQYRTSPFDGAKVVRLDPRFVYPQPDSSRLFHGEAPNDLSYLVGNSEVRSEIAVPMEANGRRVGVLNLESRQRDAYNTAYIEAAKLLARQAAAIYERAQERDQQIRGCSVLQGERAEFFLSSLLRLHPELRRIFQPSEYIKLGDTKYASLGGLLYKPDYIKGLLQPSACYPFRKSLLPSTGDYVFGGGSFAAQVFRKRRMLLVPDAAESARLQSGSDRVSANGLEHYQIRGPLLGFPIFVDHILASVCVLWACGIDLPAEDLFYFGDKYAGNVSSNRKPTTWPLGDELENEKLEHNRKQWGEALVTQAESIRRMALLLANAPAQRYELDELEELLGKDLNFPDGPVRGWKRVGKETLVWDETPAYAWVSALVASNNQDSITSSKGNKEIGTGNLAADHKVPAVVITMSDIESSLRAVHTAPDLQSAITHCVQTATKLVSSLRRLRYWSYMKSNDMADSKFGEFKMESASTCRRVPMFDEDLTSFFCSPCAERDVGQIDLKDNPLIRGIDELRYFRFMLSRYGNDPYSRVQDYTMFGPDPKEKTQDWGHIWCEQWVTTPIVRLALALPDEKKAGQGKWQKSSESALEASWEGADLIGMLAADAGWFDLLQVYRKLKEPQADLDSILRRCHLSEHAPNVEQLNTYVGPQVLRIDSRYLSFELLFIDVLADILGTKLNEFNTLKP
jgi:hypothetical protein